MATRAHAIDRVLSLALEPWAITRPMLGIVAKILGRRLATDPLAFDEEDFERRPAVPNREARGLAVIPIHGCIAPRMNSLSNISGGATFEQAGLALREALAMDDVRTIVLDIDSPGGSVLGASEFARQVMAARTKKPIVAVANYQMCSAAYWVGACATEIVAAPSAMLGSIGVYTIHEDLSKSMEQDGIKLTYVSAGKYKVDGIAGEPLTESAEARMTAHVNAHYDRFVGDVAKGRGVTDAAVRSGYGEGAAVNADEALAAGMIDRIATLDETLVRFLGSAPSTFALRATADVPLPSADTPLEPPAPGHDRARALRDAERAFLEMGF
jgi:signal peptide peptidase SppA